MTKRTALPEDPRPDDAINRVLKAEQAAQEEIRRCRGQALAILREARTRARAVSARADRRIALVRRRCDAAAEQELATIELESRSLEAPPHLTPELSRRLDASIERLIGEMLA
jgi:hypothetical protein